MVTQDITSLNVIETRRLESKILRGVGYAVIESENGLECLDKIEHGLRPDLILMNVMMPKMDGWAASRKIKSTTLDALMSLESAYADWHLDKHVSRKTLIETVGRPLKN
jgi:CheY-like chemotaxis protein